MTALGTTLLIPFPQHFFRPIFFPLQLYLFSQENIHAYGQKVRYKLTVNWNICKKTVHPPLAPCTTTLRQLLSLILMTSIPWALLELGSKQREAASKSKYLGSIQATFRMCHTHTQILPERTAYMALVLIFNQQLSI